jgi:hypothetical protein
VSVSVGEVCIASLEVGSGRAMFRVRTHWAVESKEGSPGLAIRKAIGNEPFADRKARLCVEPVSQKGGN